MKIKKQIPENLNTEYKSSFNDTVIETLTAFANTKGGQVWIGVNDAGIPIPGFAIGPESIQQYLNETTMNKIHSHKSTIIMFMGVTSNTFKN